MTPENWKLVLAFGGLFLTTVTGPILWALIATSRHLKAEISASELRLKLEIAIVKSDITLQMAAMQGKLEKEMAEMEGRLNQRIDTRLVHR
jgi:hypothetical protein